MKKSLALVLFGALACNCALAETASTTTSATGNIIFSGHVDRGAAVVMVKRLTIASAQLWLMQQVRKLLFLLSSWKIYTQTAWELPAISISNWKATTTKQPAS